MSLHSMRRHASSSINKNQQSITNNYIYRERSKTHLSTFSVSTLALGDRRKPTLAAASASWAFFAVASSRCSLVQVFFGRRGLAAGLGRLRIGSAALFFAFFGCDDEDEDDDGERRLRGDALSCLFAFGFGFPLGTRAAALCRARFSSRSSRARTS
jgi:hypothetical protein